MGAKRSPGSREFGIKLTLPQIKIILKLVSALCDSTSVSWESKELDSIDALERKMNGLFESVTGEGFNEEKEYGADPRRMHRSQRTIEGYLDSRVAL